MTDLVGNPEDRSGFLMPWLTLLQTFQAANNLTVLSREEGACQIIIQQGGLDKLKDLLFSKEDTAILQAGVRVLGSLTQGSKTRVSLVCCILPNDLKGSGQIGVGREY